MSMLTSACLIETLAFFCDFEEHFRRLTQISLEQLHKLHRMPSETGQTHGRAHLFGSPSGVVFQKSLEPLKKPQQSVA